MFYNFFDMQVFLSTQ